LSSDKQQMCTPHVRISETTFNQVISDLISTENYLNPTRNSNDLDAAAYEALLQIRSAIIYLENARRFSFFDFGLVYSGSEKISDQVLITHKVDYSEKPELPAEVTPQLAIS